MKELTCRDLGFDCEGVVTGETEHDVLTQVAAHAKEVHALSDEQVNDPDFSSQASRQVHEKA